MAVATAVTAGAAAVAIAGAMGATAIATLAVGVTVGATALVSGLVVGTGEIINQCINKGIDNINLGSIAISTFSGAADGALIAGALFTGPLGKLALIGGRVGVSILSTALYGLSESYDRRTIGTNIGINAGITFFAGLLTYLPVNNIVASIIAKPIMTGLIKGGIQFGKILMYVIKNAFVK